MSGTKSESPNQDSSPDESEMAPKGMYTEAHSNQHQEMLKKAQLNAKKKDNKSYTMNFGNVISGSYTCNFDDDEDEDDPTRTPTMALIHRTMSYLWRYFCGVPTSQENDKVAFLWGKRLEAPPEMDDALHRNLTQELTHLHDNPDEMKLMLRDKRVLFQYTSVFESDYNPAKKMRVIRVFSKLANQGEFLKILCGVWTVFCVTTIAFFWSVSESVGHFQDSIMVKFDYAIDVIYGVLVLLQFNTTILNDSCVEHTSRKNIFLMTIQSKSFWCDVVSFLPIAQICSGLGVTPRWLWLTKAVRGWRLFRVPPRVKNMPSTKFMMFRIGMVIVVGGHLFACVWFCLVHDILNSFDLQLSAQTPRESYLEWWEYYAFAANEGIYLLLAVDRIAHTPYQNLFHFACVPVGAIAHAYIFGQIVMIAERKGTLETQAQEHAMAVKNTMTSLGMPPELQLRMMSYFTYERIHLSKNEIDVIFRHLSPQLRFELSLYFYIELVSKAPMFHKTKPRLIREMVLLLEDDVYLPGDFVCRAGERGDSMYFVAKGSCAVLSSDLETRIAWRSQGSHFGEIALLTGVKRTAFVRAEECCTLAQLTKERFEPFIVVWPEEIDVILQGVKNQVDRDKLKEECIKYYNLRGPPGARGVGGPGMPRRASLKLNAPQKSPAMMKRISSFNTAAAVERPGTPPAGLEEGPTKSSSSSSSSDDDSEDEKKSNGGIDDDEEMPKLPSEDPVLPFKGDDDDESGAKPNNTQKEGEEKSSRKSAMDGSTDFKAQATRRSTVADASALRRPMANKGALQRQMTMGAKKVETKAAQGEDGSASQEKSSQPMDRRRFLRRQMTKRIAKRIDQRRGSQLDRGRGSLLQTDRRGSQLAGGRASLLQTDGGLPGGKRMSALGKRMSALQAAGAEVKLPDAQNTSSVDNAPPTYVPGGRRTSCLDIGGRITVTAEPETDLLPGSPRGSDVERGSLTVEDRTQSGKFAHPTNTQQSNRSMASSGPNVLGPGANRSSITSTSGISNSGSFHQHIGKIMSKVATRKASKDKPMAESKGLKGMFGKIKSMVKGNSPRDNSARGSADTSPLAHRSSTDNSMTVRIEIPGPSGLVLVQDSDVQEMPGGPIQKNESAIQAAERLLATDLVGLKDLVQLKGDSGYMSDSGELVVAASTVSADTPAAIESLKQFGLPAGVPFKTSVPGQPERSFLWLPPALLDKIGAPVGKRGSANNFSNSSSVDQSSSMTKQKSMMSKKKTDQASSQQTTKKSFFSKLTGGTRESQTLKQNKEAEQKSAALNQMIDTLAQQLELLWSLRQGHETRLQALEQAVDTVGVSVEQETQRVLEEHMAVSEDIFALLLPEDAYDEAGDEDFKETEIT